MDNRNPSTLQPPKQQAPSPHQMGERALRTRKKLEECFKQFHEMMTDKVLDANKTAAVKNTERKVVDDLLHSVVALENVNVGQGMLSLLTISVREHLHMRDRVNELEYELYRTKRDLKNLEKKMKSRGSGDDGKEQRD